VSKDECLPKKRWEESDLGTEWSGDRVRDSAAAPLAVPLAKLFQQKICIGIENESGHRKNSLCTVTKKRKEV
jgi:hypothetical protein